MSSDASSTVDVRPSFLKLALSNDLPARAISVSIIVGTVLTLINQGDALLFGQTPNFLKMALTYLVPYCVVTCGAVSAMQKAAEAEKDWPSDDVLTVSALVEPALPAPAAEAGMPAPALDAARQQVSAAAADVAAMRDAARRLTGLLAAAERDSASNHGAAAQRAREVAETVSGLARRMHLTALNASLEAVRAGSAGENFAALAGELNQVARQIVAGSEDLRRQLAAEAGTAAVPNAALHDAAAVAERHLAEITALAARIEFMERSLPADTAD
ncbi:MAG: nitrate/nitrite transporter NrtS [Alphaproteobacteria bacterium]